jgi:predicted nucleotidyltransferase component of viral defense system
VPYSDCRGRNETLRVYSTEEILTEKLCALLARTEPRDLHDVHYMLSYRLVDAEAVALRLGEKMTYPGLNPANETAFAAGRKPNEGALHLARGCGILGTELGAMVKISTKV